MSHKTTIKYKMFNDSFNKALASAYYKGNFLKIADCYRHLKTGKKIRTPREEDFYEREHRCFKYVPKLIEQMIQRQDYDKTNLYCCPEVGNDDDDAEEEQEDEDDESDITDKPNDDEVINTSKEKVRQIANIRNVIEFKCPDKCDCQQPIFRNYISKPQQPFRCGKFSSQNRGYHSNQVATPTQSYRMFHNPTESSSIYNRDVIKIYQDPRNCYETSP